MPAGFRQLEKCRVKQRSRSYTVIPCRSDSPSVSKPPPRARKAIGSSHRITAQPPMLLTTYAAALALWFTVSTTDVAARNGTTYPTKSGIKTWVDPDTPQDRYVYTSSRGRRWDLVMSDEFNVANRSFRPGDDHIWTSLEKPDGVNGALELYSHNMTSTKCDDDGTCYFYIKTVDEVNVIHVYNMYTHPPSFTDVNFFYRAAMVQSWNKFCYQGGMLEVRRHRTRVWKPRHRSRQNRQGSEHQVLPDLARHLDARQPRPRYLLSFDQPDVALLVQRVRRGRL